MPDQVLQSTNKYTHTKKYIEQKKREHLSPEMRQWTVLFVIFAICAQFGVAKADAGDVVAGILGAFMILTAICAGLGWWSRRQSGTSTSEHNP